MMIDPRNVGSFDVYGALGNLVARQSAFSPRYVPFFLGDLAMRQMTT
jgi:hypothetical protein